MKVNRGRSLYYVFYFTISGLVAEYLSIVPQQRKFVSPITGDIVANSAKWKPDFSLVKASNAFRAIEQYAANLINQPWRFSTDMTH